MSNLALFAARLSADLPAPADPPASAAPEGMWLWFAISTGIIVCFLLIRRLVAKYKGKPRE
ncbi:MAG: hypothetical protein LBI44_02725 [Oscillospiraceae bacterium]|jgi:hypothetical protein|nr:hypothetical protein [Oscillospiraceae bacterium]